MAKYELPDNQAFSIINQFEALSISSTDNGDLTFEGTTRDGETGFGTLLIGENGNIEDMRTTGGEAFLEIYNHASGIVRDEEGIGDGNFILMNDGSYLSTTETGIEIGDFEGNLSLTADHLDSNIIFTSNIEFHDNERNIDIERSASIDNEGNPILEQDTLIDSGEIIGFENTSYAYDENGQVATEIMDRRDAEGHIESRTEITHEHPRDDIDVKIDNYEPMEGKHVIETTYDKEGNMASEVETQYNPHVEDSIASQTVTTIEGDKTTIERTEYVNGEIEGKFTTTIERDDDGKIIKENSQSFDKDGNLMREETRISDTQVEVKDYDKEGNIIKESVETYNENGDKISVESKEYGYDSKDQVSAEEKTTFDIETGENTTDRVEYCEDGSISSESSIKKDEEGMIESSSFIDSDENDDIENQSFYERDDIDNDCDPIE